MRFRGKADKPIALQISANDAVDGAREVSLSGAHGLMALGQR